MRLAAERLASVNRDIARGRQELAIAQAQIREIEEALLRLHGAKMVLEELAKAEDGNPDDNAEANQGSVD